MSSAHAVSALVPTASRHQTGLVAVGTVLRAAHYTHTLVHLPFVAIVAGHFTNLHLKWGKVGVWTIEKGGMGSLDGKGAIR